MGCRLYHCSRPAVHPPSYSYANLHHALCPRIRLARLQARTTAVPISIPDEDDDRHDAQHSRRRVGICHLVQGVDQMHADPPVMPTFDSQYYLALSHLPLTYPWPVLILDLTSFTPLMDRHVLTHMVAGRAHHQPQFTHPGFVLSSFLKDLAQAIVSNILFPLTSEFMRPSHPSRISSTEFWHAQLNYACLRAEPNLAGLGYTEGLAGDQLCQWNTIVPDAIIPATHLTLFLPPSLGAYVMANHQTHKDFKPQPTSPSPTRSRSFYGC